MSDLNDNKKFWKNVKPIFGNKNKGTKTITLVEGNEAINNDEKILINISLILFWTSVSLLFARIMMM